MINNTSIEWHTRRTVYSQYLVLRVHQSEWCQLCLIFFIAFFLYQFYFDFIYDNCYMIPPPTWLRVYSSPLTCAPQEIGTGCQILGGGGSYSPSSQPTGTPGQKRPPSPSIIHLSCSSVIHPLPPPSPILFLGRLLSSRGIGFRFCPLTCPSPLPPVPHYRLHLPLISPWKTR